MPNLTLFPAFPYQYPLNQLQVVAYHQAEHFLQERRCQFPKLTSSRGMHFCRASCHACLSGCLHRRAYRATNQSGFLVPNTIAGLLLGMQYPTSSSLLGWAPAISKMTFTGFQCAYSIECRQQHVRTPFVRMKTSAHIYCLLHSHHCKTVVSLFSKHRIKFFQNTESNSFRTTKIYCYSTNYFIKIHIQERLRQRKFVVLLPPGYQS